MTAYVKSGKAYTPNGHPRTVAGVALVGTESEADLAMLGFERLPDPPPQPAPPTEAERLAVEYAAIRAQSGAGLAAFREVWDAAMAAMAATGTEMPAFTFRDLKAKCRELGGDWPARYRDVRDLYDEVVFAAGTLAQAADILPKVLADKTLGGQA